MDGVGADGSGRKNEGKGEKKKREKRSHVGLDDGDGVAVVGMYG